HTATERMYGGEIICCGGAFNSPQLLQLSGVGNTDDLTALGIPVVNDLPGVGEHMQDHLEVYIQHSSTQPVSMAPYLAKWRRPWIGLQWLARRGPGATNHFEAGGFARSNERRPYPNVMFHFLPIAIRYDGSTPAGGLEHGYQVHVGPMYSNSRCTRRAPAAWVSRRWTSSIPRRCACTASTGCAWSTRPRCATSPTATSTRRS